MNGSPLAKSVVAALFQKHLRRALSDSDIELESQRLLALGLTFEQYEAGILASEEYQLLQRLSDTKETIAFDGCQFRLPTLSLLAGALKTIEGYEPWVLPEFLSMCKPGMIVVDVGANWGVFSIPAARRVGQSGHVWAFEANGKNAAIMLDSMRLSELSNLTLIPAAVSEEFGHAFLPDDEPTNAGWVNFDKPEGVMIPTVALDAVLSTLPRLDIIKMDIEGSEYRACLGAQNLITKFRPTVFLEFTPTTLGPHKTPLLELFLDRHYEITALPPSGREMIRGSRQEIETRLIHLGGNAHVDLRLSPV